MPKIVSSKYYYSRLDDKNKKTYMTILSGLESHCDEIKISPMSIADISKIYHYVTHDNPLIYNGLG